jgi:hypothetical protein
MGTNYYWVDQKDVCAHCGRGDIAEEIHIGKSSGAWCFSLHVYPLEGIQDLGGWIERFLKPGSFIKDENGKRVSPEDMLKIIRDRNGKPDRFEGDPPLFYSSWDECYRVNHAEPGPNGLLRHKIEHICIGHGEGTWDLIDGEFS